jgi:amidase
MPFSVLQAFNIAPDKKKKDWRQIAQHKKEEREGRLPAKWRIEADDIPSDEVLDVSQLCVGRKWLDEEELAITGLSAVDLAAAIKARKYTALTVIEAFGHRATIAQQLVNA